MKRFDLISDESGALCEIERKFDFSKNKFTVVGFLLHLRCAWFTLFDFAGLIQLSELSI